MRSPTTIIVSRRTTGSRRVAAAIVLVLCTVLVAAAQERTAATLPPSDLGRAQAAFQAGRHTEALAAARRAADAAPTSVRALTGGKARRVCVLRCES